MHPLSEMDSIYSSGSTWSVERWKDMENLQGSEGNDMVG